jgi:predicted membrane channel-forming protein YqfA (hemolysin III family)
MSSLVRTQFRLALFVCTVLGCVVGGLPLLFLLVPELREVRLLGLPLPWLVLGGLIYPAFVVGGLFYVRHAERNERHFADLVDR